MTHLHVHSHYTLLGATASVDALVTRAQTDGLTHLALTDTNAIYGVVAFARACRAAAIQPIIGMTVTVQALPELKSRADEAPGELVLLAAGPEGYRSLCRLSSLLQSSADRAELCARGLTWEQVRQHNQGLLCLSGGRQGWVERTVRAGDVVAAGRYLSRLGGIFDERAHLALEIYTRADEEVAREIAGLGARFGLPTVAVQPIYCLTPAERGRLRLLTAIRMNCRQQEVPPSTLPDRGDETVELHWLAPHELAARFVNFPAALSEIGTIVHQCTDALPDGRPIWPVPHLPEEETPGEALARLARDGLQTKYTGGRAKQAQLRLDAELAIIMQKEYAPLFLIVADIVRFARAHDVPVSTRGSVANSLVAFCLNITTVDPIAHDLLFERFLNPERSDPPDIDLDFCSLRRDEVLNYVRETYGADRVALVATISTLRPRSALREASKAHGLDESAIDRLLRLVPDRWHPDPRRRIHSTVEAIVDKLTDPTERQVVQDAFALVGQPDHLSVHPGGIVVTPGPTTDYAPVQWTPKGFLATQFDHSDVEAIGLLKVDLLGIRALTVLATATELVRQHYEHNFNLNNIPDDDHATAELLSTGDTIGVFQCESSGAQRTLRQLQCRNLQDLAIANAFFKPGPAMGGMAAAFIRRYRGTEAATYLHPALEPILRSTQGVLLFQEQILRIAREVAGLSWSEADHLRRGMSKFREYEMEMMRDRFMSGCQRVAPDGPGFTLQQAKTLWEQVLAFAGYGFNQGHATAYADVSYRSAYLRAHWPAAFLAARLSTWGGFYHQAVYMAEAVRLGIRVRPPHINHSERQFSLGFEAGESNTPQPVLWMGLEQVRSLRRESVRSIITERSNGRFTDLSDLLRRVALQKKELIHLIQCGGLDGLGSSRAALLVEADDLLRAGNLHQMAFSFLTSDTPADSAAQRRAWETRVLGQPVSVHPLESVTIDTPI